MAVYDSLKLFTTPERYFFEPTDNSNELLVVDRVSQEITLETNQDQIPQSATVKFISGIFGILRLLAGPYLIVITKKLKVGELNGESVWQVLETEVLPYQRTLLHLTEEQIQDNNRYLSMLDYILKTDYFYFSSSYDLTHSLQRLGNTSPDFKQIPLHERADQRFVWNHHVMRELSQQPELSKYCLPLLHGFIFIKTCIINGKSFDYALISRRSCFRAGTRYYIRGLDPEGHAANFVETEQIIEYGSDRCSFVQTRGSIPMFWSQRPNLKYKPTPILSSTRNHLTGFQCHFDNQIYNYGRQTLINLVDHKGAEDRLEKAFAETVKTYSSNQIRYESFDFHHECRKMRWDRLSILVNKVDQERQEYGYFMVLKDGHIICNQTGVFRTNCIDCLDRTNVVQSLLARETLQDQLQRLGILQVGQKIEEQTYFEQIYKNVWADNADACAVQYAGTGALKTDFTRTGKRTFFGLLKDGVNSTIRYFKNNFSDGFRQDSIDLLLGNYIVEEEEGTVKMCPLRKQKDWKYFALPAIFLVALSMCVISVLMPDENPNEQFLYILFWGGSSLATLGFIYYFGEEFVDQPKLAQTKTKMD